MKGLPQGPVAVENLAIGQHLATADGGTAPVKWIGRRAYTAAIVAAKRQRRTVLIHSSALGCGLPQRDLSVSPRHALLVDDVLIPAEALVDHDRARLAGGRCGYRHALPRDAELIAVRRAADGAELPIMGTQAAAT
jgi:hypothetical protein